MENKYTIGAIITGIIAFFIIWIYAFSSWGFLIGLAAGWIPAIIGGFIIGLLWPLILILLIGIIIFIFGKEQVMGIMEAIGGLIIVGVIFLVLDFLVKKLESRFKWLKGKTAIIFTSIIILISTIIITVLVS
jgi:hypothetical protein